MKRKKNTRKTPEIKSGPADEISEVLASTVMGLTPKQVIALNALVAGKTKEQAAKAANIHRNAIQYWMIHDRYFRSALQLAKLDLFGTFYEALRHGARRAIDVMVEIAEDHESDAGNRLSAAKFLLEKSFETDRTIGPPPLEQENIAFMPQTARCGGALAELDVIEAREELEAKFKLTEMGKRAEVMRQKIAQIQRQIADLPHDANNYKNRMELEAEKTALDGELSYLEQLRFRVVKAIPIGRWWGKEQAQEFLNQLSNAEVECGMHVPSSNDQRKEGEFLPRQLTKTDIALRQLNERCMIEQRQAENGMRRPKSRDK